MNAPPPAAGERTAVLLCADLETLGHGLDLRAIQASLTAADPSVRVRVVPDLCRRPDRIAGVIRTGSDRDRVSRLVLGLCGRPPALAEVQAEARKAGLDPLGVELVNLGTHAARVHPRPQPTAKAAILLAGVVAKARAFGGSRAENLKPVLPAVVSRRSLVSLTLLEYQAVPSAQAERCRVEQGCRECIRLCPFDALDLEDGAIRLAKSRCTACGVCVTACPHEVIDFPGAAPEQIGAQIATLLSTPVGEVGPRAILIVCRHGARALEGLAARGVSYPPQWLPIEVPSLAMVPATWLLGCIALGAAAVAVIRCPEGCDGPQTRSDEAVDYCRTLLGRLGDEEGRIRLLPNDDAVLIDALNTLPAGASAVDTPAGSDIDLFAYHSRARTVLGLVDREQAPASVSFAHAASPFGFLEVAAGCTLCGDCARACPTGALLLEADGDAVLSLDAARCTACEQCLPTCPEPGVLRVRRATDRERLSRGRTPLIRDRYRRCVVCGEPIAPEAMLRRITALLGGEHADTVEVISQYCPACRSSSPG